MSLAKKLEAEYAKGFNQACDFFEKALFRTKGVGVKKRAKIMEQVRILAVEVQRPEGNRK